MKSIKPVFECENDIGTVSVPGRMKYDETSDIYTLTAAGANMWFGKDAFFLVWMKVEGDFEISGDIDFVGEGVNPHRKLGFMIREDLSEDCAYADIAVHGDGLTSLQYRPARGAETFGEASVEGKAPTAIALARRGNVISARSGQGVLPEGDDGSVELDLPATCYVGLFLCSHEEDITETCHFRNVTLTQ